MDNQLASLNEYKGEISQGSNYVELILRRYW